jgi:hypothetical protein
MAVAADVGAHCNLPLLAILLAGTARSASSRYTLRPARRPTRQVPSHTFWRSGSYGSRGIDSKITTRSSATSCVWRQSIRTWSACTTPKLSITSRQLSSGCRRRSRSAGRACANSGLSRSRYGHALRGTALLQLRSHALPAPERVASLQNERTLARSPIENARRPHVFFSGALHGDERVGPLVARVTTTAAVPASAHGAARFRLSAPWGQLSRRR